MRAFGYGFGLGTGGGGGGMGIGLPVAGGVPNLFLYVDNAGNLYQDPNAFRDSVTNDTLFLKQGAIYDTFIDVGDTQAIGVDHVLINCVNVGGGGNDTALMAVLDGAALGEVGASVFIQSDDGILQAVGKANLNTGWLLDWNDGNTAEFSRIELAPGSSAIRYRDPTSATNVAFLADATGVAWRDHNANLNYYFPLTAPTALQTLGSTAGLPGGGQLEWISPLFTVAVDGTTVTGDGTVGNPLIATASVNGLIGAVTLVAGTNITLTPVGNNITIDASTSGITRPANEILYMDPTGTSVISDSLATRTTAATILGKTIGNVTRKLQVGTFNGVENAACLGIDTTGGAQRLAISGVADLSGFGFGTLATTQFYQDNTRDSVVIADVTGVTAFYDEPGTPGKTCAVLLRPANSQWFYSSGNTNADSSSNITIDNNLMSFIFTSDVTQPLIFTEMRLSSNFFNVANEVADLINIVNDPGDINNNKLSAGFAALVNETSGVRNISMGPGSGTVISDGDDNAFYGFASGGAAVKTGVDRNSGFGKESLYSLNNNQTDNTGLGYKTAVLGSATGSIAIGSEAVATNSKQCVIGSNARNIEFYYYGGGVTDTNAFNYNIVFKGSSAVAGNTDQGVSMLQWESGDTTGSRGGVMTFSVAKGGASGTTLHLAGLNEKVRINPDEFIIDGGIVIATNNSNTSPLFTYGTPFTTQRDIFHYLSDGTGSGTTTITLSGTAQQIYVFSDYGMNCSTNNIVLDSGGGNVIVSPAGAAQTFTMNQNGMSVTLHHVSGTAGDWMVI